MATFRALTSTLSSPMSSNAPQLSPYPVREKTYQDIASSYYGSTTTLAHGADAAAGPSRDKLAPSPDPDPFAVYPAIPMPGSAGALLGQYRASTAAGTSGSARDSAYSALYGATLRSYGARTASMTVSDGGARDSAASAAQFGFLDSAPRMSAASVGAASTQYSVDGGVRLAGGRPGSDEADVVPYGYPDAETRARAGTRTRPPPYGTTLEREG